MRIKKNGKVINLTESDIKKISKSLLKEQEQIDIKAGSGISLPGDWTDPSTAAKYIANLKARVELLEEENEDRKEKEEEQRKREEMDD